MWHNNANLSEYRLRRIFLNDPNERIYFEKSENGSYATLNAKTLKQFARNMFSNLRILFPKM